MWAKNYIAIFLGYILMHDIYTDIFKSPQQHFINAKNWETESKITFF